MSLNGEGNRTLMVVLSGIIIAALRYLPPPGRG